MRSASFKVSSEFFFQMIGLNYFQGTIDKIYIDPSMNRDFCIDVIGDDNRLPDDPNFPKCNVICKQIEAHFEKIGE